MIRSIAEPFACIRAMGHHDLAMVSDIERRSYEFPWSHGRSRGYGESLLDAILAKSRSASVREIFLEVRPSNTTALALYRKKGFHKVARRPAYYQATEGREDAAVLAKKLITHDR